MTSPESTESLSIANELISARTERGISQAQLAELSGVSRSAIKAYETGRNMPGSRELRAICVALKTTPNRLLFGTEAPDFHEGPAGKIEALLRSDPEESAAQRARLAMLATLLTHDEYRSVLQLVQSLALARHGAERVEKAILNADLQAGIARQFLEQSAAAAKAGQPVDPEAFAKGLEEHMKRQGHTPSSSGS
ncbi:helix-turn-helix transcriptional regulator [Methylibium sp.]|uniref:helix-turn-helix transcriptional regulator n=1 Tax=Methylibium sp. TaxID=2067992 RepID=UPI003BAA3066